MAKNIQRKDNIPIKQGMVIKGKWNNRQYVVLQKIGEGMIGTVYLCRMNHRHVALKISTQALSITTEVNVLKSLNKVQDNRLGPFLFDVDDWETRSGDVYSFYVMEYIQGTSMETFIKREGSEWIGVFLVQILEQLEQLHRDGWVFGDLKNDNLLITSTPPMVRFVDVGGTTRIGRSIKEYSEFYDRAYWQLGTREAEPSYDLFAIVMVMLAIFHPNKFKRVNNAQQQLLSKIDSTPQLRFYRRNLQRAILGEFQSAKEMKEEIMRTLIKQQASMREKRQKKYTYLIEAILIFLISGVYYIISIWLF